MALTRTTLLPKNKHTQLARNYRPIACENNLFKIYTGIIANFVNNHCQRNNIVCSEQAANRPGSWGCVDQLFINKNIMEETVKYINVA